MALLHSHVMIYLFSLFGILARMDLTILNTCCSDSIVEPCTSPFSLKLSNFPTCSTLLRSCTLGLNLESCTLSSLYHPTLVGGNGDLSTGVGSGELGCGGGNGDPDCGGVNGDICVAVSNVDLVW